MKDFFNLNNGVWIELGKIWDYIVISFLWIICSIPLVTIGAATSALYYSSLQLLFTGNDHVVRNFFHAFRTNFKQSTLLWLIMCGLFAFAAIDIRLCVLLSGAQPTLAMIAFLMLLCCVLILTVTLNFLFPIQCWFENSLSMILRNAIVLSIHHFGFSLLLLIINGGLFFVALCIPNAVILLPGTLAFIHGLIFRKIFRRYIPDMH